MTAMLEINDEKYYMEWDRRWVNQNLRAEVFVSTERAYRFRMRNQYRQLVHNADMYFRGENSVRNKDTAICEYDQPTAAVASKLW